MADYYCGCCGYNKLPGTVAFWCEECSPHIGTGGAPWNRTYGAQFDEECPVALAAMEEGPMTQRRERDDN